MKLKFCGIRRMEDVIFCNTLRPDYMGMILSPGFRRSVSLADAASLVQKKSREIAAVGVFVNPTPQEVAMVLEQVPLDVIQLHGKETEAVLSAVKRQTGLPVWKAVRVQCEADIRRAECLGAAQLVLEGYVPGQAGGTGVTADWNIIAKAQPQLPFLLAGGLTADNLEDALKTVHPDGVDFSSGIETAGKKDFEKMEKIVKLIRGGYHG